MIKVVSEEERERRLRLAVGCATRHVAAKRLRDGQRTTREAEIIALAAVGHTDEEAAGRLGIDPSTPGTYWKRAMMRFGSRTRTEAACTVLLLEIVRLRAMVVELRATLGEAEQET